MAVIPGGCTSVSWNRPFKAGLTEKFDQFMESGEKTFTKAGNVRSMSMKQICESVVECWEEISPDIIRKSFKACGQTQDVDAKDVNCFKEGKICHGGLERLEKLLKLDVNLVDFETLSELPDAVIQEVEAILEEDIGDGIEELIENELCLEKDDDETGENEVGGGMVVDIMGNEEDEAVDKSDNEDDINEPDEEGDTLFHESSLFSIKRGAVINNNKRKRHLQLSAESSPNLKKFRGDSDSD